MKHSRHILVDLVRAEMGVFMRIIDFDRRWQRRNAYRICWFPDVEQPSVFHPVSDFIAYRLVHHDKQLAIRTRQRLHMAGTNCDVRWFSGYSDR